MTARKRASAQTASGDAATVKAAVSNGGDRKPKEVVSDPPIAPPKLLFILKLSLLLLAPYCYVFFYHYKIHQELRNPILINAALSVAGFFLTVRLIPVASRYVSRKNMFGYDINKKGTPQGTVKVPESLGIVVAIVFLVVTIVFQYFNFTADSMWLVEYNAALACICFMTLLGFVDDVLDIPWRVKLILPSFAALPLLMAYAGHTTILIPKPLVQYVGLEILVHNIMQIGASSDPEKQQAHAFSIYLVQPLLATSLALLSYNWYPSSVFVGDTYTYFAGMTMAVVGILGHYRFDPDTGLLTGTKDGTLVNLYLRIFGKKTEKSLCAHLLLVQTTTDRGKGSDNGGKMEIGFLGLGIMGKAMSMNLIKKGFKCDELVEMGASVGETPAAVIKKCKITIAMVSDPAAALSVVFDKNGVLEEMCGGKGYVDMSTVDPETSTKISEAITSKGGFFVEAPVSGSKQPAEAAQLVILAAGDKVGNGARMKLVVNMIMGSMMNAFSEGLVLAERSGLNPGDLLDVLDLGAIAAPMFKGKGPNMIKSSFSPAFPLKHQQKDMRLALALGDENAVSMPVAAAANEAFKKARSMGLGDLDFSAVHEVVKMHKD
ncbi:Glyoxylate/succinic semialdehyde reductase 1 [Linum grandiflorum]